MAADVCGVCQLVLVSPVVGRQTGSCILDINMLLQRYSMQGLLSDKTHYTSPFFTCTLIFVCRNRVNVAQLSVNVSRSYPDEVTARTTVLGLTA